MNIGLKIWEKQHKITLEEIKKYNEQYKNELILNDFKDE